MDPAKKWESFGFYVQSIDGNDIDQIDQAIINAKANKGKPGPNKGKKFSKETREKISKSKIGVSLVIRFTNSISDNFKESAAVRC